MEISSIRPVAARAPHRCAAQRVFNTARLCGVGGLACAVLASSSYAEPPRDALSEMTQCTNVGDPIERLHCFDAAAARAQQAVAPSAEGFGKPPAPAPQVEKITATVREILRSARGLAIFVLDNGQTWRQLDGDDAHVMEPRPGKTMKVTIERGAFGSYNLLIDGRNGLIRVQRIQ